MSHDPPRLFDDPAVADEVREALHQMADQSPQPYDAAAGLARFQAAIGSGGSSGGGGGTGSPGAPGLGLGKTLALGAGGLGLAGAIVVAVLGLRTNDPPASVTLPAPVEVAAPASSAAPTSSSTDVPVITPESLPTAERSARVAPSSAIKSKDELYREELEHLARLKSVAGSSPAEAVRMADEGHARFTRGMLYQEREAIAIRSLSRAGQSGAARSRAERFLARFPKSPYAEQIRMAAGMSKP